LFQDQDQDQDFRNIPRPKPRPTLFGQDQDQDLHMVSDNLAKKQLQTMHLSEQSNVVKSTTAAYNQKHQLIGNFLNKYTNRYMQ